MLALALAVPLMVYAWVGSYARYVADDFCWAGVLRTEGFFQAQLLWYTGYSPRYAFTLVINLVELAGPAIVPVLPTLAILVLVATLTWTLVQFGIGRVSALVLAEGAALATLHTAPDLPQSLYWQTGMLTYLLPLILAAFLIGWIRRALCSPRIGPLGLLVSGVVTFFAGGLAETHLIPQNVALTLVLCACLLLAPRGAAPRVTAAHLGAALAGGVLALLVILVAPATTYRVGGSPADLWLASSAAIATGALQILRLVRYFPLTVLMCLALPGILAASPGHRIAPRWFWLTTAGVAITLPFCYFPSFYAQNGNPPARSLIIPGAMLIAYAVFVGYTFRDILQRIPEPRRVIIAAAVALVPLGIAITTLPEQAVAAQHAALWDAEDQLIRASRDAGQTDVVVQPRPRYLGEDFVTPDRDNWFNVCVARYYGLRSIAATSSR